MKNTKYSCSFIISSLFMIFLSINVSYCQNGWYSVTSPQSGYHLYGIYFKDVNTGVCCKFKTTDGGNSWYQTSSGGNYAMFFADQNTGYRTGSGITKTTNLGENWISQTNPGGILYGVYFCDINTGYSAGSSASIIKTTNGGQNWVLLQSGLTSDYYFHGVYFTNVNTGYLVGHEFNNHSSVIVKTTNGGVNFTSQSFPSGTHYYAIWFINNNTGVAIGEKIVRTTDAGAIWIEKPYSGSLFQQSIYFSSANTGYSAGWSGRIVKTTDGGETWFRQTSGTGSDLESVYFLDDNTGFVCGDNGVVLKTTDGGGPPIGIKPISNTVPNNFSLYQNYPNPFNPVTRIKFDVTAPLTPPEGGKQANVILKIFDARGREIAVLVNFALSPGSYEVTWEASNYPSGVYFYTLTTNSYKETRRMVLLK